MEIAESFERRRQAILDLGFPAEYLGALKNYILFLWTTNASLNLFSRQMTASELIDNHILDCLLPFQFFPRSSRHVADFGSGGGLPGVIYAIACPGVQFTLYEKSPKKQIFLNGCRQFAPTLKVAGEIPVDLKDVDLVCARGFKSLAEIFKISENYLKSSGGYFLLKGRRERIDEEIAEIKGPRLDLKVISLQSPVADVERHLVCLNIC